VWQIRTVVRSEGASGQAFGARGAEAILPAPEYTNIKFKRIIE